MAKRIIVPATIDMAQATKKITDRVEIRVWCNTGVGDAFYYVFENVKDAQRFIRKHKEAERVPLFAFNGFEFNLLETKLK